VTDWIRPAVIGAAVLLLIIANIVEFRGKRRAELAATRALDEGSNHDRLLAMQYRQTQNIEQLLHVISTMLVAILAALLWT